MSSDAFTPQQLYLLLPWDLPVQEQLTEAEKTRLCKALHQLLQALENTSYQQALDLLDQELATLDMDDIHPIEMPSTQTPLKVWEVEDYDRYFDIVHVQAQAPAICLVRGVLLTYRMFLVLSHQNRDLDPLQVKQQKQGFASYVYLLARVFHLPLEKA